MRGPMLWLQCRPSSAQRERVRRKAPHGTSPSRTGASSIDAVGAATSGESDATNRSPVNTEGTVICTTTSRHAVH